MRAAKIKIGDIDINYYESPAPSPSTSRQTVFLIHGNSSSAAIFRPQFESELANKYRLMAIDLPGHGDSEKAKDPENTYFMRGLASTLVSIAEKVDASDAIFVAWSMGGNILLEAIESLPLAKGFCIYGTAPIGVPPAMGEAFFPTPLLEYVFNEQLSDEQVRQWADYALKPGSELDRQVLTDAIERADERVRASLGNAIVSAAYTDEIEILKNLSRPIAILHGKEERLLNIDYLKSLDIPTLWRESVQVISDAGHSPHIENPEEFNSLLEEFIEDVK